MYMNISSMYLYALYIILSYITSLSVYNCIRIHTHCILTRYIYTGYDTKVYKVCVIKETGHLTSRVATFLGPSTWFFSAFSSKALCKPCLGRLHFAPFSAMVLYSCWEFLISIDHVLPVLSSSGVDFTVFVHQLKLRTFWGIRRIRTAIHYLLGWSRYSLSKYLSLLDTAKMIIFFLLQDNTGISCSMSPMCLRCLWRHTCL